MKKRKGFTLVELLAVIAILAIILLIAVPMILGVIEDAKQESFRNSVRGVFHAIELYNARTGSESGTIAELDMSGETLTGFWNIVDGKTTLIEVTNGTYCVASLNDANKGSKFPLTKDCSVEPPKELYKETILNGADPVIKEDLIPIIIANDGAVKKADTTTEWYNYNNKQWANAVILMDKTITYKDGDTIPESNIESYFVWIPRYKYKIFDEGTYTDATELQDEKEQLIEIVFEDKTVTTSTGSTKDSWLTHPAFTSFDVNGIWVGKFEVGYKGAISTVESEKNEVDVTKVIVKPNTYSWRTNTVKNFFETMYNYNRSLDSHMMKNTEWGAVVYLSHSKYGIGKEIAKNNYNGYMTGCGSAGVVEGQNYSDTCDGYTTVNGFQANTTGNITGIYDMNGGANEYVAGYRMSTYGSSGFDVTSIASYQDKYFDVYNGESTSTTYNYRILGDATGEVGPFAGGIGSWYGDTANFVDSTTPWFGRGGKYNIDTSAGAFYFNKGNGNAGSSLSTRLTLIA